MANRSFLMFALIAAFLAGDASAKFLPDRKPVHRPRRGSSGATVYKAVTQRGPLYETPSSPNSAPNENEVGGLLAASRPGMNDIAVQSVGLAGAGSCGHSATDQINAITAQLQQILAKVQQDYANEMACIGSPPCALGWANQAIADASQALTLGQQAQGLQGQAAAEAACAASGGSSGSQAQANPAGLTYENLAQRFGVSLGGLGGGLSSWSSGGGFSSPTFDLLNDAVQNGEIPDYDGSQAREQRAAKGYQRAAEAAAAIGSRVEAGREFAGKPADDFSDPQAAAQQEYLRINFDVLGPKYAALAKDRSEKADAFAQAVVDSPPALPLPSTDAPLVQPDEDGLSAKLADGMADEGQNAIEDVLTKGWGKTEKALLDIAKIDQSVFSGLSDLADALPKALDQLGSGSTASGDVDAWQSKQSKVFGDVAKTSQEAMADMSGFNPDPAAQTKSALRDWLKARLGSGDE